MKNRRMLSIGKRIFSPSLEQTPKARSSKNNFNFSTFKHSDKANSSYDVGVNFTKSHIERIKDLNSILIDILG